MPTAAQQELSAIIERQPDEATAIDERGYQMATETGQGVDRFVRVGELNLHCLEWGLSNRPTVIMIHGLTGNAHNFDRLAPYFLPQYHVLSIDVRGRGDSDWAQDGAYTTEAYVRDLEGLRAALGLQRLSLIGTSMGGRISLAYAAAYPQWVERAVINDIGPEIDPRGVQRIFRYVSQAPQYFQTLAEVIAWYRQHYPMLDRMSDEELGHDVSYSLKPHPAGGLTWKMDPAVRQSLYRPVSEDAWAWVKEISAPLLLIRGAESDVLPPQVAQRMVQEAKDCRLVEVPGVGHVPLLTEPVALDAIKEFFDLS